MRLKTFELIYPKGVGAGMQNTFISDPDLVQALRADSEGAFEQIYERYWNRLYRIAVSKIKSSDNAKEIVQDIFLDLWLRRHELTINILEHYLLTTVKFKILDFFRKEVVRKNHEQFVFVNSSDAGWDTEEELAYNDLNQAITACIDQLPPRTKTVIELSRLQHRSIEEIAEILNVSSRTVDNHLSQGLKALRMQLKEYHVYIFLILSHYLGL